jgi:hypothetical protein
MIYVNSGPSGFYHFLLAQMDVLLASVESGNHRMIYLHVCYLFMVQAGERNTGSLSRCSSQGKQGRVKGKVQVFYNMTYKRETITKHLIFHLNNL